MTTRILLVNPTIDRVERTKRSTKDIIPWFALLFVLRSKRNTEAQRFYAPIPKFHPFEYLANCLFPGNVNWNLWMVPRSCSRNIAIFTLAQMKINSQYNITDSAPICTPSINNSGRKGFGENPQGKGCSPLTLLFLELLLIKELGESFTIISPTK